jgi:hypothetical protein
MEWYKLTDYFLVRFEVLRSVKMTMLFFWVVTPCRLVDRYQRFGETYCLHLQGGSGDAGKWEGGFI